MSQDHLLQMECTVCHNLNYQTKRNKKSPGAQIKKRLELKKFCKFCKKMQLHKETK